MRIRSPAASAAFFAGLCGAASAQTPAAPCAEVFVQDYEYDDGGRVFREITPCAGDDLQGSPAYPVQQKKVHKEYVRGDYFAVQTSSEWHWEPGGDGCAHVTHRVTRVYKKVEGGIEESALVNQEGIKRSRDTGEHYGGHFIAGGGARSRVPRNAPGSRVENTRFDVKCVRLDRAALPLASIGDGCLPILETPKCQAELHLMPIELTSASGDGVKLTGRTTRLELLPNDTRLDRSNWLMP
ncbi:MAG: hypothetical protein ABI769_06680 [Pseudomonadota bacterium]